MSTELTLTVLPNQTHSNSCPSPASDSHQSTSKRTVKALFGRRPLVVSVIVLVCCLTTAGLVSSWLFGLVDNLFLLYGHWPPTCPTEPCTTALCKVNFQLLQASMNLSADPCDDFHQYVCGNWSANSDGSRWALQRTANYKLVQLSLAAMVKKTNKSRRTRAKSKSVLYMVELYRQLTSKASIRSLKTESVRARLNKRIELNGGSSANQTEHRWIESMVEAYLLGVNSLINTVVVTESETIPGGVDAAVLLKADQTEENEDEEEEEEAEEGGEEAEEETEGEKETQARRRRRRRSVKVLNETIMASIAEFRNKLTQIFANVSKPGDASFDENCLSNEPNASIHLSDTRFSVWARVLNTFAHRTNASFRFTNDSEVLFDVDMGVLESVTELLANTSGEVLQHWIAAKVVRERGEHFAELKQSWELLPNDHWTLFQMFVQKDYKHFVPVYTRLMADLLGRPRVDATRDYVIELMHTYKQQFAAALESDYTWLDHETRRKAIEKVDAIRMSISHPDWIYDDAALDQHCGFGGQWSGGSVAKNFVDSYLNLLRLTHAHQFNKVERVASNQTIGAKMDFGGKDFFFIDDLAVNQQTWNLVEISSSLLFDPTFNVDYPMVMNHGALGATLGHELMHSFDNQGRCYDWNGDPNDWWSAESVQGFNNLSKCYVQQFDGLVEPVTGVRVNGSRTLGENIADGGGVRLSFRVFQQYLDRQSTCDQKKALPEFMQQFSQDQLFFITYATSYCSEHRNSSELHAQIEKGEHSPDRLRINQGLANFDRFAQAFHCPVGSPMNRAQKCKLW